MIVMPVAERRGGAERTLEHLLTSEVAASWEWRLLFLEDGPMVEQYRALGLSVDVVPAGRLRQPRRVVATSARLRREMREWRPSLVLSWMPKAHLYAGPAAAAARARAAWYQHDFPTPRGAFDRVVAAIPASGVIATSEAVATAQRSIRPARRTIAVPPGVDLARYAPAPMDEARRVTGLPPDRPIVGIVARLQRWKGVQVLIDAMPQLVDRVPDIQAVIVGGEDPLEPNHAEWLARRAAELGVGERVRFAGFQSDTAPWMRAMNVVVNASRNEPFGLTIVEAMALGKPVVAAAEGGPTEIIVDQENGQLVPALDPRALADAVLRYLEDGEFRTRIGEAAARRARNFSSAAYADRLTDALTRLVAA
jgi:glycosyltransferase involved in cell wall biosynthesis